MPVEDKLVNKWKRDESSGLKGWLERNVSKKQITPALEFLTGAYEKKGGEKGSAAELAMAIPVIGQAGRIARGAKKIPAIGRGIKNILFKNKYLYEGTVKGASGSRQSLNRKFADIMGKSEFSPAGRVKNPSGGMTDVFISDKSAIHAGREMRTVAYKGKKDISLQPFYKSTGRGTPELKTAGEWIPFEGILTRSAKIKSWEKGGAGIVTKSKRTGILKEVSFQNDPGWLIKGYRNPGQSKILGQAGKRGLTIHQETNKILQAYFNK
jgi:hypothetical protein